MIGNETMGSPGYFEQSMWDFFVDAATDQMAEYDGYYDKFPFDFNENINEYPNSQLYKVESVYTIDPTTALWLRIGQLTPKDMDIRFPSWRTPSLNGSYAGIPQWAVFESPQSIVFWPPPNYTTTQQAGYVLTGYAIPSTAGYTGNNIWPNDADVNPLPAFVHRDICWGAAYLRCFQFMDDKHYAARIEKLEQYWEQRKSQFFRKMNESNAARRTANSFNATPGFGLGRSF